MAEHGVDVLLLSVGADLPWLIGYEAMPLERLTMLVVPGEGEATLVVPRLEAPRVVERGDLFSIQPWGETDDPIDMVASLVTSRTTANVAAIGDHTWAQFLIELGDRLPATSFRRASAVTGPLRAVKDRQEIAALAKAGAAVDRIARDLQAGGIPLIGRTEAQVSADIGQRILAEGHQRVNFAIVAAGEHAASPHHEAGDRLIRADEVVLCDFGGTMLADGGAGYCSDITRCVYTGDPPAEFAQLYDVLFQAHSAAVAASLVGAAAETIDFAARSVIDDAGFGEWFIHRTGHGIGVDAHEDPYIVAGNSLPIVAGNVFSIEPGIYLPQLWGARLEDIVVATVGGPISLNQAEHRLVSVDA